MSTAKKNSTFFDDDFEVTYEEDVPFTYSFDTKQTTKQLSDATVVLDAPDYRSMPGRRPEPPSMNTEGVYQNRYVDSYDGMDDGYTDDYDSDDFDVEYYDSDDYEDEEYDIDNRYGRRSRSDYRDNDYGRCSRSDYIDDDYDSRSSGGYRDAPGGAEKMQARTYPACSLLSKKRRNTEQKGSIVLPVP